MLAWSLAAISVAYCALGLWLFAQVPIDQVGGAAKFWPQVTTSLGMLAYAVVGGLIAAGASRACRDRCAGARAGTPSGAGP